MINVLYEDNHIIVVNKSCSDIVQGDKTGDTPLKDKVAAYLKEKYNKPGNVFVGVVHRLDRPVSGAVVFARTSKALSRMNKLFANKDAVNKSYWAIVKNAPSTKNGVLEAYLKKNEKQNKSYVVADGTPGAKKASLEYKVLQSSDKYHLLEVKLHTGRHHQIRVQLASMGCIIKGDLKYGFPRSNPNAGIDLHSRFLGFEHPVSKQYISITAPVPDNTLWKYFEQGLAD
jgi:23S rRNA pseudouridine1911/1915/1917 synthase